MRVGANSPSLCPTIDSLMNTGTCFLPSCTASVWPTISGKIVEVRDQVLSIFFVLAAFMASMRAIRRSSTHGPFLLERLICPHFLPRTRRASRTRTYPFGAQAGPSCASHTRERGRRSGAAIRVRGGSSLLALSTSPTAHYVLV